MRVRRYTSTEIPSVEIMGEIKEELSVIDLGFGNLSVSPTPHDSSFGGTDGSSTSMVKSDVLDADHLLSAFKSISIVKPIELTDDDTKDCFKADALESNGNTDLSGQKHDTGNGSGKFDLVDLPTASEPSTDGAIDGDDLVGFDKTSKENRPLILYTSSRRNTHKLKLNQNNESKEKPSKGGRMARKKTVVDVNSLQILRKSRSSVPKRRSFGWGDCLEDALPYSKDHGVPSPDLGNEKKEKRVRGGKGKKDPAKGQIRRESIEKKCPPAGRISLKIKIGNKLCTGNATESCILSGKGTIESIGIKENLVDEKVLHVITPPLEKSLEKVPSDAYALNKPPDVKTAFDSCFSTSSDFHSIIGPGGCDNLVASVDNLCSDIGTSPDSEVINTVPDVSLCEKGLLDVQTSSVVSNASVYPSDNSSLVLSPRKSKKDNAEVPLCMGDASSMSMPQPKFKKGKKKVKLHGLGGNGVKSREETTNKAEVPADLEMVQKLNEARVNSSKPSLDCPDLFGAIGPSNSEVCEAIPCRKGQKTSKSSRAKGGSKRFKIPDLSSKKNKSSKKKGNKNRVCGSNSPNEKAGANDALDKLERLHTTGNQTPIDLREILAPSCVSTGPLDSQQFSSDGVMEQCMPVRSAWVLCDECEKWRRIPATLCDQIEETNQRWTCKENPDRNYADCAIPQEKSDSAINEELGISETSWEEDAGGTLQKSIENRPKASERSSWSLIKSNLFLHRSRKKQTIDEVMVCHCKPSLDGRLGCGAKCLNRMLNIECVVGTCPCGELCSNQQFQKRNYSKLKWFKCGKKGYGLQALGDISTGQFLIEYVGEVLDVRAYEARQREYALNGHRHFYFMTLNGSEVIDACAKGNLGRFINHSCDPNCRTEKWMVNGEVCIGLFSLRDIKKGEEVTFDYNYVRVFGAAAKKCVCGSPYCRGYIGGDPTNSEVIVQDDSDDEYSEPAMICEDRELNEEWNDIISSSLNGEKIEIMHEQTENGCNMEKLLGPVGENFAVSQALDSVTQKVEDPAQVAGTVDKVDNSFGNGLVGQSEINEECGKSLSGSVLGNLKAKSDDLQSQMSSSELMNISLNTDGSLNKEMSSAHESVVTVASPGKSLSDTVESKKKLKYATVGGRDGISKSKSLARTKRSSNSVRKAKPKANAMNDKESSEMDKLNATLHKAKKLPGLSISHFEAVEEKLNELLDPEGGISKRKDASRGYLKLLFLTAASGNNVHGEAIQSNRDLSMILDALLKTKSRSVLVDIINKNGLQMLHNIMKRYRKEFNKTPILRKLLKVLEHLALRHILTPGHITGGPPCPGVESFKDSILSLTEHADKQVHQIARSFRDRWIPRHLRKSCCIERDNGRGEINQQHSSHSLAPNNHKSDQDGKPSEATNSCEKQPVAVPGKVEASTLDSSASGANVTKTRKRKSRWDNPVAENQHSRTSPTLAGDEQRSHDEDIPPGFSSCNGHPAPPNATSATTNHIEMGMHKPQNPCDVILGISPVRFNARMPVSYGISRSLVQQFGVTCMESSEHWSVAPGVPFLPFPPLPSHPHSSRELPAAAARCAPVSELTENPEQHNDTSVTLHAGQKRTRTCSMEPPDNNVSVPNGQPDFQQGNGLGRKYFRQQKWNQSKLAPPWVRMRNGWGHAGNNPQNNPPGVGFGMGTNGFRNVFNWQETNWRG